MSSIHLARSCLALLVLMLIPAAAMAVDNRPPVCEAAIDGSGATGLVAGSAVEIGRAHV